MICFTPTTGPKGEFNFGYREDASIYKENKAVCLRLQSYFTNTNNWPTLCIDNILPGSWTNTQYMLITGFVCHPFVIIS